MTERYRSEETDFNGTSFDDFITHSFNNVLIIAALFGIKYNISFVNFDSSEKIRYLNIIERLLS